MFGVRKIQWLKLPIATNAPHSIGIHSVLLPSLLMAYECIYTYVSQNTTILHKTFTYQFELCDNYWWN